MFTIIYFKKMLFLTVLVVVPVALKNKKTFTKSKTKDCVKLTYINPKYPVCDYEKSNRKRSV